MTSSTIETTANSAGEPSIGLAIDPSALGTTTTSATPTTKSIEQQLADTAAAQRKRRLEMSSNARTSTMRKVVHAVSTDHNTARLALICLALVCSFFGSLLLVIAGPSPPQNNAKYSYEDLMRLMTLIHDKSIEITPNLSKKSWEEELKNGSLGPASAAPRFSSLLQEWWPIKSIDYESSDAILNDYNFYSRNYKTFQAAFIVLMTFGDFILLISWMYFLAAKELQIYRHRKQMNGHSMNGRITSPQPLSERAAKLWEKVKRFFAGKSLKKLKRSWVDEAPRRPWQRPLIVTIISVALINFILFILLLSRPNMFTLVLHQVIFVLLAIVCLASTEVHETRPKSAKLRPVIKEIPRSLRSSNGSTRSNGSLNRVHHQTPEIIAAPILEEVASEPQSPKPIFVTEQSKASTSTGNFAQTQPHGNHKSTNPFGSDEEEDEEVDDEPKRAQTKRQSIDEEVERELERV